MFIQKRSKKLEFILNTSTLGENSISSKILSPAGSLPRAIKNLKRENHNNDDQEKPLLNLHLHLKGLILFLMKKNFKKK